MQKMGRQTSPFKIYVGFKKEREAGLTLEGKEVALFQ
jgi:hypothetical protein